MSTTMPERIQLKRTKGWRKPPNTVSVTRPGKWGNPWRIGTYRCDGHGLDYVQERVDDAETAVRFFCHMVALPGDRAYPSVETIVCELRGKNLACWCKLGEPCHADVLLRIANE